MDLIAETGVVGVHRGEDIGQVFVVLPDLPDLLVAALLVAVILAEEVEDVLAHVGLEEFVEVQVRCQPCWKSAALTPLYFQVAALPR
jgi:hypothetical protein